MSPEELDNKFTKVVNDIQGPEFGKIMVQAGQDALKAIRERILNTGIDADGSAYKPYSTKPMLSGCSGFINKSKCPAGSKGKRKDMKWVTLQRGGKNVRLFEIPGGYKEFRELNDRQTNFVDFSFTNKMWGNIKVINEPTENNAGIVRIAATTELDKNKLKGNTEHRGPILKLSTSELKEISERFNIGIVQIFHNNGL